MAPQHADRPERLVAEEQLAFQIPLATFEHDLVAALLRQFVDQAEDHLRSDAIATDFRSHGEVQNLQPRLVQLIDHEADDLMIVFGHHADAVPLTQTAEEILVRPRELEAGRFNAENFLHVAADQPANLNVQMFTLFTNRAHEGLPAVCVHCQPELSNRVMSFSALVRCALESLALKYRYTLDQLELLIGEPIEVIHVLGGGSQNTLLCQFTADACERPVLAGPVEATAIGNILVQMIAQKEFASLDEARAACRHSFPLTTYTPQHPQAWQDAYGRFKQLLRNPPA